MDLLPYLTEMLIPSMNRNWYSSMSGRLWNSLTSLSTALVALETVEADMLMPSKGFKTSLTLRVETPDKKQWMIDWFTESCRRWYLLNIDGVNNPERERGTLMFSMGPKAVSMLRL